MIWVPEVRYLRSRNPDHGRSGCTKVKSSG
jgi:hypothetical protein